MPCLLVSSNQQFRDG